MDPAGAQLDPDVGDTVAASTVLLSALLTLTEHDAKREYNQCFLGSGTVVSQLAVEGLIDELTLVVNPMALGRGKTLFESVEQRLDLRLVKTRAFANGNVVLSYAPAS
jgi:dihydrofolate reductase